MASITWWNRLEPRPRSTDITDALAARVRDPLWMLSRQWQLGEFQGEDAASPAYVQVSARLAPVVGWRVEGQPTQPLPAGVPLEELVETEAFGDDLALRVELGQTFEELLAREGAGAAVAAAFRAAYPIALDTEAVLASMADQDAARFQRVCAGRALDGVALYQAAYAASPAAPEPVPSLADPADRAAATAALAAFDAWVRDVFDEIGLADAPAWRAERLEYGAEVVVTEPTGGTGVLAATPGRDGDFDWYAFDERPGATAADAGVGAVTTVSHSTLPMHVRFRGMPNHRFWDFESGQMDFGAIEPDTRDLGKLIVIDFMLVHGNDWFLVPFEQPVGTLCRVDSLVVHDVFGGSTLVERADAVPGASGERWTMFSTAVENDPSALADYFHLPHSAAATLERGPALEDVRFLRDQMANMAWAVEHATENGVGEPWQGHERAFSGAPAAAPVVTTGVTAGGTPPVRYQIQTPVPENWIPLVPVAVDPAAGEIALEPGAMVRTPGGDVLELVVPHGRVLRPTALTTTSYRIREEEVPRTGTRVTRVACRTRWTDGSTHLWIARRKGTGAGEGSSGLRFDLAVRVT